MAKKKKGTTKSQHELLENPEALAEQLSKTEAFIERNKTAVLGVIAVVIVSLAGLFFYRYWVDGQNETAQLEMFQAQYWFEADSLDLALNGDGNHYGFLEIIESYGATKAANLAKFYAGVSYLKKGDFDSAIEYLNDFSSSDLLIQARAYSLIGDAHMEKGNFEEALSQYRKAANHNSTKFFSPQYLMKAATAQEKLEDYSGAIKTYDTIIEDFSDSSEKQDARKHKARIERMASK
ncbi:tetratricopeptide repeat protein [Fulvivirgaceae bacterium BMA10]|uniref:Tetratricopeptide repeat protein n=1 Tax=Splendidivirga corallicola TaxID=3051826 RepID=A0ABT8KXX3_9BACT|nr:tetratricopeptide repeat protein [Fulvivirgaceae bacterium BMA10]